MSAIINWMTEYKTENFPKLKWRQKLVLGKTRMF